MRRATATVIARAVDASVSSDPLEVLRVRRCASACGAQAAQVLDP